MQSKEFYLNLKCNLNYSVCNVHHKVKKMENIKVKLRENQRNYLLKRIMIEKPVEDVKIQSRLCLQEKLRLGESVEQDELLKDYVELNSIVSLRTSFGFKHGLKLVLPEEADIQNNKLSIFSSLGSALFGNKVGDIVKWFFLNETEFAEIIKVSKSSNRIPKSLWLVE